MCNGVCLDGALHVMWLVLVPYTFVCNVDWDGKSKEKFRTISLPGDLVTISTWSQEISNWEYYYKFTFSHFGLFSGTVKSNHHMILPYEDHMQI